MVEPNQKMLPDTDLPEFMQSHLLRTVEQVHAMEERDLRRRVMDLHDLQERTAAEDHEPKEPNHVRQQVRRRLTRSQRR